MAATNVRILNAGDKTYLHAIAIGSGAPADTDLIATDTSKYPLGSEYTDYTNSKLWKRTAVSTPGVAADWKGVAIA